MTKIIKGTKATSLMCCINEVNDSWAKSNDWKVVEYFNQVETLNEDLFFEKYKPILNHIVREKTNQSVSDEDICSFGGTMFETFGEEFEFIKEIANGANTKQVWTIIDQNDELYCVAGFHFIDRYGYFITEKSWTSGEETFTFDTEIDD